MQKKIISIIIIGYKYYYIFLPFAAYLGVLVLDSSLCGPLSFFGWLPLSIYYTFFQLKYNLLRPEWKKIILNFVPLLLLSLTQAFIKDGSIWSVFISAFIYEICTLSLALALLFINKLREAKEEWVIAILATLFVGGSGAYTLMILVLALYQNNQSLSSLLILVGLILADIIAEISFLRSIINRSISLTEIMQSEDNFDKNLLWFIFALFLWVIGMLLIKELYVFLI